MCVHFSAADIVEFSADLDFKYWCNTHFKDRSEKAYARLPLKIRPQRKIKNRLFGCINAPCQIGAHKITEQRSAQAAAVA